MIAMYFKFSPYHISSDAVTVFRFEDAPAALRDVLFDNGGDEDWLAIIPPGFDDWYISWIECSSFGCCSVNKYHVDESGVLWRESDNPERESERLPDRGEFPSLAGCKLRVGCHA